MQINISINSRLLGHDNRILHQLQPWSTGGKDGNNTSLLLLSGHVILILVILNTLNLPRERKGGLCIEGLAFCWKNLRGDKQQYTIVFKTIGYCYFYCFFKILGGKRLLGGRPPVAESQKGSE